MAAKQEAHELLQDLERVCRDLNRIPNRVEYQRLGKFPTQAILDVFGSYALMLKASGLSHSKGKVTKEEKRALAFEKLQEEIEQKKIIEPPKIGRNIILLGDLHAPFMHPQAIDFIKAVVKKYGFDLALATGDETDGHAISFHGADPDLPSPGHEFELAIRQLRPLYEMFPDLLIASSNHGDLLARKFKHHGLPVRALKTMQEILECPPGWKWAFEHIIQMSNGKKLLLHHAYSSNVLRASQHRGVSCAFGHHHSKFSVEYWRNYEDLYFAIFAGCLVDETALAMAYGKNIMHRPITGLVRIEDGIPHLIPMIVDGGNVWNGKI